MILVPVYWKYLGVQNFLWFSDIALFLTLFALWFRSPLLISMLVISILPFEIIWNIDFFYQLVTRHQLLGATSYMFDTTIPLFVRLLSLFHVFLPVIWLSCLYQWGYDKRAFLYAMLMCWTVLIMSYFFTDPKANINSIHAPPIHALQWIPPELWLIVMLIVVPLFVLGFMHLTLMAIN